MESLTYVIFVLLTSTTHNTQKHLCIGEQFLLELTNFNNGTYSSIWLGSFSFPSLAHLFAITHVTILSCFPTSHLWGENPL